MSIQIQVSGVGCTNAPGLPHIDKSFKELLVDAVYKALDDADISPNLIDGASFSYAGEGEIGHGGIVPTLVDALGLAPLEAYINIGNCASAHMAFLQGCEMIESGRYKHVLVAGFDKMTDILPFENYMLMSTDSLYDYNLGFSHIDSFLFQQEYISKYKISPQKLRESLLKFSILMRKYGAANEVSSNFGKDIPTLKELETQPFFGNAMNAGEGASAIILSATENESRNSSDNKEKIIVAGRGYTNTSHYIPHRYSKALFPHNFLNSDLGLFNGVPLEIAINRAYSEAKISVKDLNILELYDQGLNGFISIEAAGICSKGEAVEYICNGGGTIDSAIAINTDGGNIARGHAGGGASLYQIIEIVKQLQGRASGFQIKKRKYGLSTVIGGAYATTAAVVLKNEEV
ncbi:thiolase family protein [Streptococcus dentasini]